MKETSAKAAASADRPHPLKSWLLSPIAWGGAATLGFYTLIPYLPVQRDLAVRYFCSHPLEYATTTLFFVGIAILAIKAFGIGTEKRSFRLDLSAAREGGSTDPITRANKLREIVSKLPSGLRGTHLVRRIRDACAYVNGRGSGAGLEEHLKSLAELAAEQLHRSYALVRTITWAVPILGFLGTVIGITIAIANVTPEQLESSLGDVTGGLAVAFDTTALALGLSLVLVFAAFVVERAEQQILAEVEEFGIKRLAGCLATAAENQGPLAQAEAEAGRQLLERTEALINWQTKLWQDSLESIRNNWTDSLEAQRQEFDAALQLGMSSSLSDHAAQLEAVRGEFLEAFRGVSSEISTSRDAWLQAQQQCVDSLGTQIDGCLKQLGTELSHAGTHQSAEVDRLLQGLSGQVSQWQAHLQETAASGNNHLEELRRQGEVLSQIVDQEADLARLQGRLADNLEVVRATETFEQTMNSLSAAVHLLSARTRPKAA